MNKSYFSDSEESQTELFLFLVILYLLIIKINNSYDTFSLVKCQILENIINEKLLISLIKEM